MRDCDSDWSQVQRALDEGAASGVAPAMVLLAWDDGRVAAHLHAGAARPDTAFDLASLTKPLATALMAAQLEAENVIPRSATLGEIWGQAVPEDKAGISLRQLLCHCAGYPAWRPYYELLLQHPPPARPGLLKAMLMNEPLEYGPGEKTLYSDLGYMLLGLVLGEAPGGGLPRLLDTAYDALGVAGPRYLPLGRPAPWPSKDIAPCGPLPDRPVIHGEVEDENAHALGGVAGHAGLFGTAMQVAQVMDALGRSAMAEGPWYAGLAQSLFAVDAHTPGSRRTPGFDTPCGPDSLAGSNYPPGTVGHLGFTGVSLWWQPYDNRGVVLLTNRVAHGRDNDKIRPFRRLVHDMAWPRLGY